MTTWLWAKSRALTSSFRLYGYVILNIVLCKKKIIQLHQEGWLCFKKSQLCRKWFVKKRFGYLENGSFELKMGLLCRERVVYVRKTQLCRKRVIYVEMGYLCRKLVNCTKSELSLPVVCHWHPDPTSISCDTIVRRRCH